LDLIDKKALIESKHKELSVSEQCEFIGISRSSYYYKAMPMSQENIKILHKIDEIATDNSDYGYRLIHKQLEEDGYTIGKNRVLKYMGILGIQAIYPTKKRVTSIKHPEHKIYEYLLKQYWTQEENKKSVYVPTPNEVWSGDITYIRINGGFMYLAAVIDWHSKAVLAYKISNSMDATLATDVLQEVLAKYPKPKIFNSDQGSQYNRYVYIPVEDITDELIFIQEHFLEDQTLHMKNQQKYIAITQKARVMHRTELYTMLDKLYSKLYIKKRGVHILRHTFGKRMVKKNVNLSTIKELMGHENIQTTMIYARSDEKGMIKAMLGDW
jgi:hypothetical protein